tara:strand:+ start:929 stop:1624 length:696 start_codon:yes stop_codon:yes gene_type:complete
MKVALCLSGIVGTKQKFGKGCDLDYSIGYEYLKDAIIKNADVDIFIHSWSIAHRDGLCKLYNPVDCIFEKQVDFGYSNPKSFATLSQAYTRKTSVRLALNYEIKNNFKYDFIVLTRFDLAWFKKINFKELNKDKIYAAGPEAYGKINDLFFIANSSNMEILTNCYDKLPMLENLNSFDPSFHRAVWKHLNNSNLLPITKYIFNRPWGSSRWIGDVRLLRLDPNVKFLESSE